ncbi:MAG: TolC family protein, partial [Bacteroidetes bacterium]|nr:TolC family protein [Bacteroidota bacterium]
MKKISLVILGIIFIGRTSFSQGNPFSLKQCIDTAIANNLQVQKGDLQMQAAEISWKQSKLNMLPDLIGSASHGSNQGRSIDPFTNAFINQQVSYANYGLSSGVVLFNGLSMQNSVKQTRLAYEASKMDWQQLKDNLTINIILAYLQVLSSEDQLEQSKKQEYFSRKQVERLEILNKEGSIAPSQLYDLRGQLANDQLSIINTTNALESAKINLCQLMNITYDTGMTLERIPDNLLAVTNTDTPDSVLSVAFKQFSLVKAATLHRESAEKAVKATRGQLYPTLSLGGNINTNYSSAATQNFFVNSSDQASSDYVVVNGNQLPVFRKVSTYNTQKISYGNQLNNNLYTGISLNLRVPIFNSLQTRNRIKLAQLDYKNTQLTEKNVRTELQQSV